MIGPVSTLRMLQGTVEEPATYPFVPLFSPKEIEKEPVRACTERGFGLQFYLIKLKEIER